jgi:hypothetical protein
MRQDKSLQQIYATDPVTNQYLIEIGLAQYVDIFSEWDPAPFKRRTIDPDLALYLEESCEEIPASRPIKLCFSLPAAKLDRHLEIEVLEGLKNSFTFKQYLLRKELRKTTTKMVQFVLIGLLLLGIATLYSDQSEALVRSTLVEGLFIAGWVFLWEAVSLFFFTNRELYHQYRLYKKLENAPVIFRAALPN